MCVRISGVTFRYGCTYTVFCNVRASFAFYSGISSFSTFVIDIDVDVDVDVDNKFSLIE